MTTTLRDDRIDPEHLDNYLFLTGGSFERPRYRSAEDLRPWQAQEACVTEGTYLTQRYAAGMPLDVLADTFDLRADVLVAALKSREEGADGTPGSRAEIENRKILAAVADLLLAAASFGRGDIVASVLEYPAVAATPSRVLDAVAVIHGVSRPESDRDRLTSIFRPWLQVGSAPAGRRQDAFEKYMRGWRAHNEKARKLQPVDEAFTGAWAFEAVVLAQALGLDDGPVRDVPEYPGELADFAREAGLPRLDPEVRLPGPAKRPAARKKVGGTPLVLSGTPKRSDLAALLTAAGETIRADSTVAELLDAAVATGTIAIVDWKGVDPEETGELLQLACTKLGVPVPEKLPEQVPTPFEEALVRFDAWLEPVGVRLIDIAIDADQVLVTPVLAADYEAFAGQVIDGYRIRSMEQLAADEA
ncbi:MAG TPA: DUF1911 domain-containing protein [Candidatus Ruania gallistercoris]|uniref:DUF1911 domain-containing protein n=1 Tax=Candidatus Ruania gallistercoris TaxID=2838746 RepID=A0A9D2EG17_9MICO|nr:DUF1911 domain-containing protein [Candidatus Ruania gallistercoris]